MLYVQTPRYKHLYAIRFAIHARFARSYAGPDQSQDQTAHRDPGYRTRPDSNQNRNRSDQTATGTDQIRTRSVTGTEQDQEQNKTRPGTRPDQEQATQSDDQQ